MSSSRSSSSQATSQTDNRRVIGEGGVSAENSNVSITHNTLDNGAINAAFNYGNAAGAQALSFGSDAIGLAGSVVDRGFNFGNAALDFGSDALAGAFDFGETAMRQAADAQRDAYNGALGFANTTVTKAVNSIDNALAFGETALGKALGVGVSTTAAALDNLQVTQQLTKDAYEDAKGRGALTDKMIMAAIAAMAIVAFMAVRRG